MLCSLDTDVTTKKENLPNGKKTKGRVKIKMEFIDNKLRKAIMNLFGTYWVTHKKSQLITQPLLYLYCEGCVIICGYLRGGR